MTPSFSSLNLVSLGPPGSGAAVQEGRLADRYSIPCVNLESLLSDERVAGSVAGREAAAGRADGHPVSDRVVGSIELQRTDREDCARGFLLEGFPQTLEQAHMLDGWLAELGRSIERVVMFRVAAARPEVESYFRQVGPVVDLHRSRALFVSINGAQPEDHVSDEVLGVVGTPVAV